MRKIHWLLLCLLSATSAHADSTKDVVNALRASMANTQLVLKNFSGEDKVLAEWSGTSFELEAPRWQTFGVLSVESIKVKGSKLTLRCVRHVAVRDKTGTVVLYPEPDNVDVDIDLKSANPAAVLPKLKDALFYPSINDALAAIPKDMQTAIPARIDTPAAQLADSLTATKPLCDCADSDKPACVAAHAPMVGMGGMVPPKYLHGQDPGYSEEAKSAKLNGSVVLRLKVDANGRPFDVWVTRPLGLGLDEQAARSVLTYAFKPALCHQVPVSVYLGVEVNFQID